MKNQTKILPILLAGALSASAWAYNLSGTVKDETGIPVQGATVSLIKHQKSTLTDTQGFFTFVDDGGIIGLTATKSVGFISIKDGILQFSQSNSSPAQVRIFDMMGNQVTHKNLTGSGSIDLRSEVKSQGIYFARVRVGNAEQTVKFATEGSYNSSISGKSGSALFRFANQNADDLKVVAAGFDTLTVHLTNLDTVVALTLKKAGTTPVTTSSSSGLNPASSPASSSDIGSGEQTFAFGYALKNAPRPSKGCGSASKLQKTKSVENGDRFEMNVNGENREFFITLPKNYDNNKPYKLLFAMHCMGSNAEDFVHHSPDYDHPTPYYGQQQLDKEGNYIFVAPRGDTDGMPWSMSSDKDHKFIDQLITLLEENYCIDTTRIFSTGFSFGAMFTNSLAWDMQHRLRAVAVYAAVDQVIWLPKNAGKPIAWMGVHGKRDGTCQYSRAISSTLPAILKNNGKADANGNFTDASSEKPEEFSGTAGHLCYDFKTVDERFPVKFCSWNGQHQWTAHDGSNTDVGQGWQNTWVPEEVHKFLEQF